MIDFEDNEEDTHVHEDRFYTIPEDGSYYVPGEGVKEYKKGDKVYLNKKTTRE